MITLIGKPSDEQCVLCPREGTKAGIKTRSDSLGEGFLCWNHLKKMAAIEADKKVKTETQAVGVNGS